MADRNRRKTLKNPLLFLILYVFVGGFLLAMSSGSFVINFKELAFSAISSVQRGVNSVYTGITNFFSSVAELAQLKKDYELLTEKLEDYKYLQRNNVEIRKENERLKELLDYTETLPYDYCTAQIIARDPNANYSSITINKGSKDGIGKGMPVIAVQNGSVGLVGKIISVGPYTSMILPIYDYQCNISAKIEKTRDIGIVSGNGYNIDYLTMSYIKKRVIDEIQYGDVIVTSGENDNYMKDIPIGTISYFSPLDYDNSLELQIVPVIDFNRLENVIVANFKNLAIMD
ncbi:MAG: rod shape-determining protein MreC [Treponemataceae bacterium]|nr:rod shape-determining protein MreC [Treponemataceae bacterium]